MAKELIKITYKDEMSLYRSYMSFVEGGGLFVATDKKFNCEDAVKLEIKLPGDTESYKFSGKVIWCAGAKIEPPFRPGIGVLIEGENAVLIKNKIETKLVGLLKSEKETDTM